MDKNIVVIGGCSLDCIFKQNKDGTYPQKANEFVAGGKASNQAVACCLAGQKVKIISRLSGKTNEKDVTNFIINNLQNKGVDTTCIEIDESVDNDRSDIFISIDGDNDIHRKSGAINSFTPALVDRYADVIANASFVIAQMKAPKEFSVKLINFCYEHNVPIVITPCRPEKLTIEESENVDLINKITLITANKTECQKMFADISIEDAVKQYPNKLIVTLGGDGAVFYDGNSIVKLPAINIDKVVDTTGAGDTLNGNLVAGLLSGLSLKDALTRGMMASTMKIQKQSAQAGMPSKAELDEYIKRINLNTYLQGWN